MSFQLARRAERMNPSVIREILKITERPGIISLAGGLPSPDSFPVEAMREACDRVLRDSAREALQYAASEGFGPLRDWVAQELGAQGLKADASQVLITTGSQQGLDLAGKVLIDAGSRLPSKPPLTSARCRPLRLRAAVLSLPCDDDGPLPDRSKAKGARFLYLLPNFQNPTGRCMSRRRRLDVVAAARSWTTDRGRQPVRRPLV